MATRTTRRRVTFAHPFALRGVDGTHPAGTYDVDTDEESIDNVSFVLVAWRRVATTITIHDNGLTQVHRIEPADLEASLARDGRAGPAVPSRGQVGRTQDS